MTAPTGSATTHTAAGEIATITDPTGAVPTNNPG